MVADNPTCTYDTPFVESIQKGNSLVMCVLNEIIYIQEGSNSLCLEHYIYCRELGAFTRNSLELGH